MSGQPTKYPAMLGLDLNTPLKKKQAILEVPTVGKSVLYRHAPSCSFAIGPRQNPSMDFNGARNVFAGT